MNAINKHALQSKTIVELVEAAQKGDRESFGELYQRFQNVVISVATKRFQNRDDVDELCQEIFIHAMKKITQLREPIAFHRWLRQVAHRMTINRATRLRVLPLIEPEILEATLIEYHSPLVESIHREHDELIQQALDQLTHSDRDTLKAFYFDGQSTKEMAKKFDIPIGTIKRRLHVARKRLLEIIDEEEFR